MNRATISAMRLAARILVLAMAAAIVAGCNSTTANPTARADGSGLVSIAPFLTATPATSASPAIDPTASASASSAPVADNTVWLCKPGLTNNPCEGGIDATVVDASGKSAVERNAVATEPPIDCFYVYPTVSRQTGTNASLTIDPEEREVAVAQAAQFSRVCKVYAPMYRQLTSAAISRPGGITLGAAMTAYTGLAASFGDYLANYNHGRGIVFVGHSQGAMMLIALLKFQVDANPQVRKLLVSALLLGGNVAVPNGKLVGGDFANIPACRSAAETGCVVAYSTFDTQPPADALFGRPNSVLGPLGSSDPNLSVLCVNPAAPGGGSGALDPYYPTSGLGALLGSGAATPKATTPFVSYPGQYTAVCKSGGATWLQVTLAAASDRRPAVRATQTPGWGLHYVDVNIALGNLVALVGTEAAASK